MPICDETVKNVTNKIKPGFIVPGGLRLNFSLSPTGETNVSSSLSASKSNSSPLLVFFQIAEQILRLLPYPLGFNILPFVLLDVLVALYGLDSSSLNVL